MRVPTAEQRAGRLGPPGAPLQDRGQRGQTEASGRHRETDEPGAVHVAGAKRRAGAGCGHRCCDPYDPVAGLTVIVPLIYGCKEQM